MLDITPLCAFDYENFKTSEKLAKKTDDPDSTPYASKYEARKLLHAIELKLKFAYLHDSSLQDRNVELISAFAWVLYQLAVNYSETEERSLAEVALKDALKCMDGFDTNPAIVFVFISVQNVLSFIYSSRSEDEMAHKHLMLAKKTYECYKLDFATFCPINPSHCLRNCCQVDDKEPDVGDSDFWLKFEQLYTLTLFYLAQVCQNLNEFDNSALYCHETLVRQLNYGNYDPLEWALNSATLSQYYITKQKCANFTMARHCLVSALAMLDQKFASTPTPQSDRSGIEPARDVELDEFEEKVARGKSDVYRCFAKYGLALLETSKDSLSGQTEEKLKIFDKIDDEKKIMFEKLEYRKYENLIVDELVVNFEGARSIFLAVQSWLNKAKQFYALDGHTSDFIEITQDFNRLFKLLSFFEFDPARKKSMTKRRFDLLNCLLKEISPRYYLTQCRQIYFDLADISSDLFDAKLDEAENLANGRPDVRLASKINQLAQQAVNFFCLFLASYKTGDVDQLPKKFDRGHIRPVVIAHLSMARLYNKMVAGDKDKKLEFYQKTFNYLKWIVNYCENVDPGAVDLIGSEFEVAKDMMELYAVKLGRPSIL